MNYSHKLVANAALILAVIGAGCVQDPMTPTAVDHKETVKETTVVVAPSTQSDTVAVVHSATPPSSHSILDSIHDPALREMLRQNGVWTDEDIQKNPYRFVQDQIRFCDKLKTTIETRKISLSRLGKQAARTVEESDGAVVRYNKFLEDAKAAYLKAEKDGKWPAVVNGFELDQEALDDRIADALERIDLAVKAKATSALVVKKVERQANILKAKTREVASLRRELVQQSEQIKMNEVLSEVGDFKEILGRIKDMTIDIDAESATPSLDDIAEENPNAGRRKTVRDFLDGK